MLDLGSVLVLMNAGRFDGSGIKQFTDKGASADVPVFYRQGKHKEILAYIENERDVTLALLAELRAMVTTFGERKRAHGKSPARIASVGGKEDARSRT